MTDKQIIIDGGVCLNCGAKTKKHILMCDKCTKEMGTVIAHKFTIDKQTKEIKQLNKQLKRKKQECEELKEEIKKHNDDMFKNPPEKRFYCKGCTLPYISKKLKQTLIEIKEIIQNQGHIDILEEQILQKISDCEGNDGL